jgi:hypothetical protein
MAPSFPAPAPSNQFGFAVKTWIAYQLEALYLHRTYYVWFSEQLNPINNGDSSNPLELYRTIDRAVKKNDSNHPKLKGTKTQLLWVVSFFFRKSDPTLARSLRRDILQAPIEMFRPQLWRLNLAKIPISRWDTTDANPAWDEKKVLDLKDGEFEIIIE